MATLHPQTPSKGPVRKWIGRAKRRLNLFSKRTDILFINTFQKKGGAARAAYRIFQSILPFHPRAHHLSLFGEKDGVNMTVLPAGSLRAALARKLNGLDFLSFLFRGGAPVPPFSRERFANPLRIPLRCFQADLVHLHWITSGMFDLAALSKLRRPVVWTLHDMWPFTGGCHYSGGCERHRAACGCCPQLESGRERDISHELLGRKRSLLRKMDLTVVAPSRWLAREARQSSLFSEVRIETIPNGIDTDVFQPVAREAARAYLNLPPGIPVILFGADRLADSRKGGDLLWEALRILRKPCVLLTFGEGESALPGLPGVVMRRLESLTDEMSLALVYSAADIFVCPSREDNLPNTVVEALSCGVPCAAFGIGGFPDLIEHGKNGWLAAPFRADDLAEGMKWILNHPSPGELRAAAREKAVSEYGMERIGRRYAALYAELIAASRNKARQG